MSPELERLIDIKALTEKELREAREWQTKYLKKMEVEKKTLEDRIARLEQELETWKKLVEALRASS